MPIRLQRTNSFSAFLLRPDELIRRFGPQVGDPHLFRGGGFFILQFTKLVGAFFCQFEFLILFSIREDLYLSFNLLCQAICFRSPLLSSISVVISTSRVYSGFDIFAMSSSPAGLDVGSNEKSPYINPADLQPDPEKFVEVPKVRQDAFGDEEFAEVKYKVLKWWYVCIARK